jgi:phosphate:Na+ symporter
LEKHLLETPALALEQAIKEILRMIHLTREALQNSIKSFIGNDASLFKKVSDQEEAVNNFQREITQYLIRLSEKNLEPPEAATIPVLLHSVNDVERIGDHTINIIELAEQKINKACSFSPTAVEEIKQIADVVLNMFECTLTSLETRDMVCGQQGLDREEELNKLQVELKDRHMQRVKDGACELMSGIIYSDFVDNVEKIGDHLTNIVQSVLKHLQWETDSVQLS